MAVITISRESGAQGSYIGHKLAERLGYLYVNREMIHEVSLEYGIREDEFEHIYEHSPGRLERFERRNREIVRLIGQIIAGLAQRDNVIIVARGAFAVLRDYGDVLNVRVAAKRSVRVRRLQKEHNLDPKQARAMLDRIDNERSNYVGAYLGLNWADAALYDLCLSTSKLNPDQVVELIVQTLPLLKEKREPNQALVRDLAVEPNLNEAINEALSLLEATGQLEDPLAAATTEQLVAIIKEDPTKVAGLIDHTLLAPDVTKAQIGKLCQEAMQYQFASVCINPTHVRFATELLQDSDVKVCTVIGFPLGATTTKEKVAETDQAIAAGAEEVDMVINIGALKGGDDAFVEQQIKDIVAEAHKHEALCKVIIETSFLTDEEKVRVCQFAKDAGADFVKTSTGFSSEGATVEDVVLMRRTVGPTVGVKASGGVRTMVDVHDMIAAGANRLGASSSVKIMEEAMGASSQVKPSSSY